MRSPVTGLVLSGFIGFGAAAAIEGRLGLGIVLWICCVCAARGKQAC